MKPKSYYFFLFVLAPLFTGGIIYILFRSDKLLMFHWFKIIGAERLIYYLRGNDIIRTINIPNWVRYSLPDGLWIFSYVSLIIIIWGHKYCTTNIFWIFILPIIAIFSELGQVIGFVPGTFDPCDLFIYIFSTLLPIMLFRYIFNNKPLSYYDA